MMKKLFSTLATQLLLSIGLIANHAYAADSAVDSLLQRLNTIQSLQASFIQETESQSGLHTEVTQGVMKLRKPGMFRWEINEPFAQLIVTDGKTLWYYDQDLEQVTQQSMLETNIDNTPAMLLSNQTEKLLQAYQVEAIQNNQQQIYTLNATQQESSFSKIVLIFEKAQLQQMRITDTLGQDSRIIFSKQKKNQSIPLAEFQFTPPPGVDVIIQ
jgi:outer membrane lipoprotein carrier protein